MSALKVQQVFFSYYLHNNLSSFHLSFKNTCVTVMHTLTWMTTCELNLFSGNSFQRTKIAVFISSKQEDMKTDSTVYTMNLTRI